MSDEKNHLHKKAKSLMTVGLASMMALNLTACNFGEDKQEKNDDKKEEQKKTEKKKTSKKESKSDEIKLKDGSLAKVGTTDNGTNYVVIPNNSYTNSSQNSTGNHGNSGNQGNQGNSGNQGNQGGGEVVTVDKSVLKSLVDTARLLDWMDYEDESFRVFSIELHSAMDVLNNANATQAQVDEAVTKLQEAIGNLVEYVRPDTTELSKAVEEAKNMNVQVGDYSEASYKTFTDALKYAESVLNSEKPYGPAVDSALSDLQNAIKGLTVDFVGLESKFEEAKAVDETKYTPESYEKFAKVVKEVEEFLGTTDHKQSEVDEMLTKLNTAMGSLVEKADKTQLSATIENAKGYLSGDYTEKTLKALEDAVKTGEQILKDENASVTEVSNAVKDINDAIEGLLEVVHKEDAQALYDKVKDTKEDPYTLDSYKAFTDALENLEKALAKTEEEGLTKEELAEAQNALQTAYDNLVKYVAPDTTAIDEAIAKAKDVKEGDYSTQTYNALQTALKKAEDTLGIYKVTQSQVDTALEELNNAYNALSADETALHDAVAKAKGYAETDYTPNTWNALQSVIKEAEALMGTGAKQSVIDAMKTKVDTAVAQLVKRADTSALQEAINKGTTELEGNYTQSSKAILKTAVDEGNQILSDANATQAQVDSATSKINSAIEGLVEIGDKETLQSLYDELVKLDENDYTPASWAQAQLGNALDTAKKVLEQAEPTVEDVSNALDALKDAQSVLVKKADFTQLNKAIEQAEKEISKDYTQESLDALNSALKTAKEVAKNENATKQEVDNAKTALQNAIDSLQVNLTKMVEALNDAHSFYDTNKDRLTTKSKQALETAINDANNLIKEGNITFEQRDEATTALKTAKENAKFKADTTELEANYDKANALNDNVYTEETWAPLQEALAKAKEVLANEEATQDEVDSANKALATALANLEKKPFDGYTYLMEVLDPYHTEVLLYLQNPNVTWENGDIPTNLQAVWREVNTFLSQASFNPDRFTQEEYEAQYKKLDDAFNYAKQHSTLEDVDFYKAEFDKLVNQIRGMLANGNYDTISRFKLQAVVDDYDATVAKGEVSMYKRMIQKAQFAIDNARPMTAEDGKYNINADASKDCFDRMNELRKQKGLAPIQWDEELSKLAEYRARELYRMAQDEGISIYEAMEKYAHSRPGGIDAGSILEDANYASNPDYTGFYSTMIENALMSGGHAITGEEAYNMWYNSQGHLDNMLNGYMTNGAVAIVQLPDGTWVAYMLNVNSPKDEVKLPQEDYVPHKATVQVAEDGTETFAIEVDGEVVDEIEVPSSTTEGTTEDTDATQAEDTTTTEEGTDVTQSEDTTQTEDTTTTEDTVLVDYSQLEVVLGTTKSLDMTAYTQESVANLNSVIAEADTMVANQTATQDEVNAMITKIQNAVSSLVEQPVVTEEQPVVEEEQPVEDYTPRHAVEYVPRHAISE